MFRCAYCGVSISKYQRMCSTCQAQRDAETLASNQAYERKQQEKRRRLQEEQEKEIARKTHEFYHRECPICAEEVKRKAMKCIHCNHEFDDYQEQRDFIAMREAQKEEFGGELWDEREILVKEMEHKKQLDAERKKEEYHEYMRKFELDAERKKEEQEKKKDDDEREKLRHKIKKYTYSDSFYKEFINLLSAFPKGKFDQSRLFLLKNFKFLFTLVFIFQREMFISDILELYQIDSELRKKIISDSTNDEIIVFQNQLEEFMQRVEDFFLETEQ
jgi:hypothetical protein